MLGRLLSLVLVGFLAALVGMMVFSLLATAVGEMLPLLILLLPIIFIYLYATQATRVPNRMRVRMGGPGAQMPFWERPAPVAPAGPDTWVREAQGIARDIKRLVRKGDRSLREALGSVPDSAAKLAARVSDLARSHQAVATYLATNSAAQALQQAAEMKRRAEAATDAFVREQYQAAAQALDRQVEVCAELAVTRERLQAEVARIVAALTSMRSRIMAVRSGMEAGGGPLDRAAGELADLQAQVDNFQESVRQVLQQASRGT